MRSRRVLVVVALLMAGGIAVWLYSGRVLSPVEQRTRSALADRKGLQPRATSAAAAAGEGVAATKLARASTFEPLPPHDAPLVQIYPRLVDEANRGNIHASCRLAWELMRCEMLPGRAKNLEQFKARGPEAAGGAERFERVTTSLTKDLAMEQAICAGFIDRAGIPAWKYLFDAAAGGHLPSRARFAIVPPLNPLDLTEALDGWGAYRAYAPMFLQEAADAGYPPAVMTLSLAHSGELIFPSFTLGGVQLAPVDLALSARYFYAMPPATNPSSLRFREHMEKKLSGVLSPEAMAQAKADGEALAARRTAERLTPEAWVPGQTLPKGGHDCIP